MKGELTDGEPTIRRREKWVDFGQVAIGMVISKQCKVNRQREREGSRQWERERGSWLLKEKNRKRKLCSNCGWWWEVTLQDLMGPPNLQSVCSWDKRPTANHSRDLCQTCLVISFHVALFLTMRLVDTAPWYEGDEDNSRPTAYGPQLWVLLHWFARLAQKGRSSWLSIFTGILFHRWCVCVCVCVCVDNMMLCRNIMCVFCCCSVAKLCPTLQPHGLCYTRVLCPPLSSRVCSSSWALNQWCYLTISSSSDTDSTSEREDETDRGKKRDKTQRHRGIK